ncbi:tetratricopeptide repeat protein [Acidobacteriota bacterium]
MKVKKGIPGLFPLCATAMILFSLLLISCGSGKKKSQFTPNPAENDPMVHYQKGVKYLNEGQCARASLEFRTSMKIDDGNSVVHNVYGLAQFCLGNYDIAISSYKKAIDLNPFYTDVHNNLGIAYMEVGSLEEALVEFNRVLTDTHYQTPEVAYFNKGLVYHKQNQFVKATNEFRKAVELKPSMTGWRIQLAQTLEKLERYEEAALECNRALKFQPNNAKANFLLCRLLYQRLNKPQKAKIYCCQTKDLVPGTKMGSVAEDLCLKLSSY